MIKIIVDSNILFSALLNSNSRIGQILITGTDLFEFYAPEYTKWEILKYKEKIKSAGHLSDDEFLELYGLVLKNITILNHAIIPKKIYRKAEVLCQDIDIDDTIFVAVSKFIDGFLWTGDQKLIAGLGNKNFKKVITTKEMYQIFMTKNDKL